MEENKKEDEIEEIEEPKNNGSFSVVIIIILGLLFIGVYVFFQLRNENNFVDHKSVDDQLLKLQKLVDSAVKNDRISNKLHGEFYEHFENINTYLDDLKKINDDKEKQLLDSHESIEYLLKEIESKELSVHNLKKHVKSLSLENDEISVALDDIKNKFSLSEDQLQSQSELLFKKKEEIEHLYEIISNLVIGFDKLDDIKNEIVNDSESDESLIKLLTDASNNMNAVSKGLELIMESNVAMNQANDEYENSLKIEYEDKLKQLSKEKDDKCTTLLESKMKEKDDQCRTLLESKMKEKDDQCTTLLESKIKEKDGECNLIVQEKSKKLKEEFEIEYSVLEAKLKSLNDIFPQLIDTFNALQNQFDKELQELTNNNKEQMKKELKSIINLTNEAIKQLKEQDEIIKNKNEEPQNDKTKNTLEKLKSALLDKSKAPFYITSKNAQGFLTFSSGKWIMSDIPDFYTANSELILCDFATGNFLYGVDNCPSSFVCKEEDTIPEKRSLVSIEPNEISKYKMIFDQGRIKFYPSHVYQNSKSLVFGENDRNSPFFLQNDDTDYWITNHLKI